MAAAALHCNAAAMAGSAAARSVVAALVGNALQFAALLRRWPATRCSLQRLAALLQQCYYDGQ
jgi:hypothetical protein